MSKSQTKNNTSIKKTLVKKSIFVILFALLVITVAIKIQKNFSTQESIPSNTFIELPDRKPLPIITLDHANTNGFSTSAIKGKWHILYFGYTFCPDICPVELTALHQMMELLRKEVSEFELPQIIFISIDPDRDTPEQVQKYVSTFDQSFIGLTGQQESLITFASPFGISWMKDASPATTDNTNDFYTMSHSTALLLINPDSKVVGMFPAPHLASDMAKTYKTIIKKEKDL